MEKMLKSIMLVTLCLSMLFITSCGDDDDESTPTPAKTKTDHLTASRWYLESSNDSSVDQIGSAWYFDFAVNKTWSGMTPSDNGLAAASGTWTFNTDETQLIVSEDVDTNTLSIVTINESTFKFTTAMNGSTIEFTFDHVQ